MCLIDEVVVFGEEVVPFPDQFIAAGGIEDVIQAVFVTKNQVDLAPHRPHVADVAPPTDAFFVEGLIGEVHPGCVLADTAFFDVIHAPWMRADFLVAQIAENETFVALFVLDGLDDFDAGTWFTDIDEVKPSLIELITADPVVLLDFGSVIGAI